MLLGGLPIQRAHVLPQQPVLASSPITFTCCAPCGFVKLLALCSGRAHIPVDQYQANLQAIVQKLLSSGVEHVVVMTPSPVYEGAAQAIPHGEVGKSWCLWQSVMVFKGSEYNPCSMCIVCLHLLAVQR
jgi:hypothetical protein